MDVVGPADDNKLGPLPQAFFVKPVAPRRAQTSDTEIKFQSRSRVVAEEHKTC